MGAPADGKVVQDNAGSFFRITGELSDVAWVGVEVKRVKGGWEPKKKARPCAVRKAFTTAVVA
jgi:hypothetical protein